ncbi:MAG: OmpA family protein [Aureispira sp.]|nr:OmpA family protein [Aureispira sp.]
MIHINMKLFSFFLMTFAFTHFAFSQEDSLTIVGYTFETDNKGFLADVSVIAKVDGTQYGLKAFSDPTGKVTLKVPLFENKEYELIAQKQGFKETKTKISAKDSKTTKKAYANLKIERLPGYLLEASITDFVDPNDSSSAAYGIEGVKLEIYNNSLQREELRIEHHPHHSFSFLLEQGYEYIFMLRKEGYYTKRMRANVNVNGCILCMEGFGTITPGVIDNLTKDNTMGVLSSNVTMKKLKLNEVIKVEDIYYDFGSAVLKPETFKQLDELSQMLRDNPQIDIELSSHTDCRGTNDRNLALSQRRAEAVVNYIRKRGGVTKSRIIAKGYGETRPVNSCIDGVDCAEDLHQQNRRTEITIVDIRRADPFKDRSLASLMQEQHMKEIVDANEETYFKEGDKGEDTKRRETASTPQVIPMRYSGYKVQLLLEENSPTLDHELFFEFDEVFIDLTKDNKYLFLVGDYQTKLEANVALANYKKAYPKARVFEYREGVRGN